MTTDRADRERRFQLTGVNYLSFPAAMLSSCLFASPNNSLLRWADRADVWIHDRVPWLRGRFRHAVLVLEKPADAAEPRLHSFCADGTMAS